MLLFHVGPLDAREITLGEIEAGTRLVQRANR